MIRQEHIPEFVTRRQLAAIRRFARRPPKTQPPHNELVCGIFYPGYCPGCLWEYVHGAKAEIEAWTARQIEILQRKKKRK